MIKPLLESRLQHSSKVDVLCIIVLLAYFQFYPYKDSLTNLVIVALLSVSTIINKYFITKFYSDKIVIKTPLQEQCVLFKDVQSLQVVGYKNWMNYRIDLIFKNGKSYRFNKDNFWTEDLCNLMHQKGVEIELLKKANKRIHFDTSKDAYSVQSKHTRNHKEIVRKDMLHSF